MSTRIALSDERAAMLPGAWFRLLVATLGAVALAAGGLAAAVWHGVDQLSAQEAARQRELQRFHTGLVGQIESLAEKSGMLTSADLCPVRFRLRFPDGVSSPAKSWHARLVALAPDGFPIDQMAFGGRVEFGLKPPGRYRLELSLAETYTLRHEFEVLPGVPIDRLVLCPNFSPAHLAVGVDVIWPEDLESEPFIAVCEVERDTVSVREWTWQPEDPVPLCLIATSEDGTVADEELVWAVEDLASGDAEIVRYAPYRSCCVRGISVYHGGTKAGASPVRAARCVFADVRRIANPSYEEGAIVCAGPAPRFQWEGGDLNPVWRIPAPDELVAELKHRAGNKADGGRD